MTEETKTPKMDYTYNVEQEASVNSYFDVEIGGETARLQITARYGTTAEKIIKTVDALITAYGTLRELHPRNFPAPSQPNPFGEPERVALDDHGNEIKIKSITAERLSVSMKDGKYYYKVVGKPFTEYGITVWPEVFEAVGLEVKPDALPNIAGWYVEYTEKPANDKGKIWPDKVTRLLPPK